MTAPKKTIGVKSLWLIKQWRVASFSAMDICLTELHRQQQAVMCCQHSGLSKWNQTPAKKKWGGEGGNKDRQQSEDRHKVSCLNHFTGTKQGLGNNSL